MVGVTGGIGSGKSTVAALLAQRGAVVVDADQIARQVTAPGGSSYWALIEHFGPDVVRADGTLDRAAIAARVFSDPDDLAALNAITHPAIAVSILARLSELAHGAGGEGGGTSGGGTSGEVGRRGGGPVVVLDIPLLTEATKERFGLAGVVVVDVPVEVAVRRLVEQRGLDERDAAARARAQVSREERRQLADVVVDNDGSRSQLEESVERLWDWMKGLAADQVRAVALDGPVSVDGPAQEAAYADGPEHGEEDE